MLVLPLDVKPSQSGILDHLEMLSSVLGTGELFDKYLLDAQVRY